MDKLNSAIQAHSRLEATLEDPPNEKTRDAAIQRFEFRALKPPRTLSGATVIARRWRCSIVRKLDDGDERFDICDTDSDWDWGGLPFLGRVAASRRASPTGCRMVVFPRVIRTTVSRRIVPIAFLRWIAETSPAPSPPNGAKLRQAGLHACGNPRHRKG